MTYAYTVSAYGRTETKINVQRFSEDLCAAMGGTFIPETELYDAKSRGRFSLSSGLRITVCCNYNHKKEQVGLHIDDYGMIPAESLSSFYGDKYHLPSITVSTARPMAALVKDVQRRLIDAAAGSLVARREVVRQHQGYKDRLAATIASLKASCQDLEVRINDRGTEASFYTRAGLNSLPDMMTISGRIYSDGTVGIDRCSSIPATKFAAVLRVLRES